jgi:hypothetical protein
MYNLIGQNKEIPVLIAILNYKTQKLTITSAAIGNASYAGVETIRSC